METLVFVLYSHLSLLGLDAWGCIILHPLSYVFLLQILVPWNNNYLDLLGHEVSWIFHKPSSVFSHRLYILLVCNYLLFYEMVCLEKGELLLPWDVSISALFGWITYSLHLILLLLLGYTLTLLKSILVLCFSWSLSYIYPPVCVQMMYYDLLCLKNMFQFLPSLDAYIM